MRILSLKHEGKSDLALNLFLELLDTQVLNEITENNKDNKLFSVKYNCYRNIGFIYEEKQDLKSALKFLVEAIDLDDTDVYTQYKIGKLALKLENLHLAKIAFEKCLHRNPNHWPSKDGLLETLCLMESINAAYGWSLTCYNEDKKYERAVRVLLEIREKFKFNIPFFDG
jgi:calcineurin-binding protein cabin-1